MEESTTGGENITSSSRIPGSPAQPKGSVVRHAGFLALGTLFSRILGLVRDASILAFFPRTVTDAFTVAFRIPNFFRRLLGEGSLNVSFIPIYIDLRTADAKQGSANAKALANALFSFMATISGVLCLLGVVYMPELMGLLVGKTKEFASVPGKLELTIVLARIMFSYLFLVTAYSYLSAVANAAGSFFWPAAAPAAFNLVVIGACFWPVGRTDFPGEALAWGVVLAGGAQLAAVIWPLIVMGQLPRLTFRWRVEGFYQVLHKVIPSLFGLGVLQVISIVNIHFAAQLPEGAHTYLYNADRLLELPQSLIAISLGTAMLPNLAGLLANSQKEAMLKASAKYTRLLVFLALPAGVGLFFLGEWIVRVLYFRGQFSLNDVSQTATVVEIYAVMLLFSSLTKVIVPSFYAVKDTTTPAVCAIVSLAAHLVLAPTLLQLYGLSGLVVATTMSSATNAIMLILFYQRKVGEFYLSDLVRSFVSLVPASAILGLVAWLCSRGINHFLASANLGPLMRFSLDATGLVLTIVSAMMIYFFVCSLCKVAEANTFFGIVRKKVFGHRG